MPPAAGGREVTDAERAAVLLLHPAEGHEGEESLHGDHGRLPAPADAWRRRRRRRSAGQPEWRRTSTQQQ